MIRLADVAIGRDNNFNLIRFVAASGVLVSHAWPIALGPGVAEPLLDLTGHSLGTLCVFIFFAVSGFFITASLDRSSSLRAFVAARGLRLFPGLAVSLLLVALVMGPLVTSLPVMSYLTHPETASFLLRNITLVRPQFTLPGVFESNPYPTVEGSIWTLIHEVLCYGLVFMAGVGGLMRRPRWMMAALAGYFLIWGVTEIHPVPIGDRLEATRRLSLPFVMGMSFYVLRQWIPLSLPAAVALVAAAVLLGGTGLAFPVLALALTYAVFWAAYVPHGAIRVFNRWGDYSYGIYIYAFPLQGLAVWLLGPMSPWTNVAIALPVTLALSVLSWHLVEEPALGLRRRFEPARPRMA